MPDRIIRDELLESDRWLDLPTDAARLAFIGFLLVCDDFGNLEGGQRRLFRFLHKFTQIKTQEAATATIDALMQSDLLRRYTEGERELFHIPRFKTHRQYLSRLFPPSPWCPADVELGKEKRIINKGLAKNIVTTSLLRSSHVAEGVGVGVGVKKNLKPMASKLADPPGFAQFWAHYPKRVKRKKAVEAWRKLNPNDELQRAIAAGLMRAIKCSDWTKEGGKYIPHPSSWLNGEQWNDEPYSIPEESRMGKYVA